jgi:hypothetical protein
MLRMYQATCVAADGGVAMRSEIDAVAHFVVEQIAPKG